MKFLIKVMNNAPDNVSRTAIDDVIKMSFALINGVSGVINAQTLTCGERHLMYSVRNWSSVSSSNLACCIQVE
jgi:hypothetical protein